MEAINPINIMVASCGPQKEPQAKIQSIFGIKKSGEYILDKTMRKNE